MLQTIWIFFLDKNVIFFLALRPKDRISFNFFETFLNDLNENNDIFFCVQAGKILWLDHTVACFLQELCVERD